MKVELYLPYYDYNDDSFDVNSTYRDSNDYINALKKEFDNSSDAVTDFMTGQFNGHSTTYIDNNGQFYQFGNKGSQNEEKVAYARCSCTIFNDNGQEETVDGIITCLAKQEPFVIMVETDSDSCEEEFESEMSLWINEHNGINSLKDKMGEEWAWEKEPVRDLKCEFINKANKKVVGMFKNCRIMDLISKNNFILFIERMTILN